MEKGKIKVFHVDGMQEYSNWIPGREFVNSVDEADLVLFEGGEDVSPELYGEKAHPTTFCNKSRDRAEKKIYDEAIAKNKKILGICRGSQFICANQPGGMLVQDQKNPGMRHTMETEDGDTIVVSSTHHQAQYPFKMKEGDYRIIGWTENMLPFHKGGNDEELAPEKECEIVFYPKANALGIQSHPEYLSYDNPSNVWMRNLLNRFLENKL